MAVTDVEILTANERRWPDRETGPWTLRLTFGVVDGRPGVVGIELYGVDVKVIRSEVGGWPTLLLRPQEQLISTTGARLPLARLAGDVLAELERSSGILAAGDPRMVKPAQRKWAQKRLSTLKAAEPPRRGRPPAYPPEHYEQVARVYSEALADGRPPTEAVRLAMAGGTLSDTVGRTVAVKWVSRARAQGLLPKTTKGAPAAWPAAPKRRRSK